MSLSRYANRKDANQPEIVEALRDIGASVFVMDTPCDLLVGYKSMNYLIEIKDGSLPPSERKLTQQQEIFRSTWRGQFAVATCVGDALQIVTDRALY